MKKNIFFTFLFFTFFSTINAQSSLLLKGSGSIVGYYPASAGLTSGIGIETNVSKKGTISVVMSTGKIQDVVKLNYSITPEYRHYFKEAFAGFFLAANASYEQFTNINGGGDFGTYLFGVGAALGANTIFKDKIVMGLKVGTQAMGPSRSDNSVRAKYIATMELGYKF
jgi:hypothetical protein